MEKPCIDKVILSYLILSIIASLGTGQKVLMRGGGEVEQRGGGSSVFEPLVRGG